MLHLTHLFLLGNIFSFSCSTNYELCFRPVESEVIKLFLIQLETDRYAVGVRAAATDHILRIHQKRKEKLKQKKRLKVQKMHQKLLFCLHFKFLNSTCTLGDLQMKNQTAVLSVKNSLRWFVSSVTRLQSKVRSAPAQRKCLFNHVFV